MKLLTLSSNNPKFRTLEFKDGLNVLVGLQLSAQEKKTINGIGKSFSLYLVHLMLGGTLKPSKPAEKRMLNYLSGYGRFMLKFEQNGRAHKVERDFALGRIIFDNEELTITKYQERLH